MTSRIVIASGNRGKVDELRPLLRRLGLSPLAQTELGIDSIEETGLTFVENALLKARHASRLSRLPAIADDSGLEVDALDGAPGIYSARYAGEGSSDSDNVGRLLKDMQASTGEQRGANFRACLVLLRHEHDPAPVIAEGIWRGMIATAPRGDEGFGYDPVFFIPEHGKTAAELDPAEKNRISHRALALASLAEKLST